MQTIQELSELTQELTKWILDIECGYKNIKLEMADVENMIEQLKLIFGDTDGEREFKIRRQLMRIKKNI